MKQTHDMTTAELKDEFDYNNQISLIPDVPDPCPHRRREVEDEYAFRLEEDEDTNKE